MPKEQSQTVVNALRLLECFSTEEEIGISDLASYIGVGKAVAARLVGSLMEFGYLQQNPKTRKYRLGPKLAYWGSLVRERSEIASLAEPTLRALSQKFQVTAHLALRDHYAVRIACKVTMGPIVYMSSRVGSTLPIHACAMGKCLLAYEEDQVISEFLNAYALTRLTEQTITDPEDFRRELLRVRSNGYAMDNEESNIGLTCFAVPLFDSGGHAVAAMSLSGQTTFMKKYAEIIIFHLKKESKKLSAYL